MNEPIDSILVARSCAGDNDAFGELVFRYENIARVVALRYVRDHHSAEDVAQQAFVRAFERLQTLRDQSKFSSWLMQIVHREAIRFTRRSNRSTVELTDANQLESTTCEDQLNDDMREAVQLLNRLPEHERLIMTLHYLDGYSTTEISRMTERSIGTVTKQLSRATKRIQTLAQRQEQKNEQRR